MTSPIYIEIHAHEDICKSTATISLCIRQDTQISFHKPRSSPTRNTNMPSLFPKNKDNDKEATQFGASASSTQAPPPAYTDDATPPTYKATSYLSSLREGDPNDKVDVP